MALKMTFWNQIQALFNLILISCLYFGFWFFNLEIFSPKFILYLGLPFFIIFALPVIIIHLNYYRISSKLDYEIKEEYFVVIYKNKREKYNIRDIAKAFIIMTPNKLNDSAVRSFPFENYYYIKLQAINGKIFIITSLHSPKIDKIIKDYFKETQIVKGKKIFPIVNKHVLNV